MAICSACGKEARHLPLEWKNWKCKACRYDELWETLGPFTPEEREIVLRGLEADSPETEQSELPPNYDTSDEIPYGQQLEDGFDMLDDDAG